MPVSTNNQDITILYGNMAILLRKKISKYHSKKQKKRGGTMN